ncbi:1-acyl-sn-glycerol-3-phosphate acyltransferase [Jatrophihabitans sp. GAS493]|uniref:lysophospholipid acyltransferase family protein n=1 Tax=Jatrophihabitans sp. GAS493 TaxID=1907575 RepID=UPI000BB752E9|nr:lysophospholipid acyltransferase family protein [Jatrophihabitans sp. GAS493]SOD70507.1 1-acyl-sn-glycerol-3-phosphate acyltransferase [Jatrophihabitans sp. GAS493]
MSHRDDPRAGFVGRIAVAILRVINAVVFRHRWRNLQNMPPRGPVIVAVNHLSHIDTVVIARLVWDAGRIPRFMAKSSLWNVPVLGFIMRKTKQIPVTRHSTDAANSLGAAVAALQQGEVVVIYPEGTTTKDPQQWPMYPKTGLARLSLLEPDVPVVPISQWGAQPRRAGERRRRRTVVVDIGEPLNMARWRAATADAETLERIGIEVMSAVSKGVGRLRNETPPAKPFRPVSKSSTNSPQQLPDNDFSS